MIEQHYTVTKGARLAGVSVATLMRWLELSGLTFARGARGRGKALLIPESVLRRLIEAHSIRLATYRSVA